MSKLALSAMTKDAELTELRKEIEQLKLNGSQKSQFSTITQPLSSQCTDADPSPVLSPSASVPVKPPLTEEGFAATAKVSSSTEKVDAHTRIISQRAPPPPPRSPRQQTPSAALVSVNQGNGELHRSVIQSFDWPF
jgi:hypothetical protein